MKPIKIDLREWEETSEAQRMAATELAFMPVIVELARECEETVLRAIEQFESRNSPGRGGTGPPPPVRPLGT